MTIIHFTAKSNLVKIAYFAYIISGKRLQDHRVSGSFNPDAFVLRP